MSDYEDIDEWAAAVDQHRGGTTTCDAGGGLTVRYRHLYPGGRPLSILSIEDAGGELDRVRLPEDFTLEELRGEAERLIASTRLRIERERVDAETRRMLISRRLLQSARTTARSAGFDPALPIVIRDGARSGIERDQLVGLLADAYRAAGSLIDRPEGWEETLASGQVDRALAEEPGASEDLRADGELASADTVVATEEGRDLVRAVSEAAHRERAAAGAIARRDEAIRAARAVGITQVEIAQITGLSQQRVAQIEHATR
jgi:hypothetical protein